MVLLHWGLLKHRGFENVLHQKQRLPFEEHLLHFTDLQIVTHNVCNMWRLFMIIKTAFTKEVTITTSIYWCNNAAYSSISFSSSCLFSDRVHGCASSLLTLSVQTVESSVCLTQTSYLYTWFQPLFFRIFDFVWICHPKHYSIFLFQSLLSPLVKIMMQWNILLAPLNLTCPFLFHAILQPFFLPFQEKHTLIIQ